MLGLATGTELRLALYGLVLAAITASYIYTHHEGYEACRAPQVAAEKAQVVKDLADAKGTIHDLETKLAAIPPAQSAPVLRLCQSPRSVRTGTVTEGAQPAVVGGIGEGSPRVPTGDAGLDVGPQLSDSKRAAEVLAAYCDTARGWALKQSSTP